MWGAAGAAPLAVSLLEPVVQGQLKGLLLPPARCPALLLALPPAACLLPGVGLLLEVAGEAVLDEAGGDEAGEDTVGHLHLAAGALQVELVGVLVQPGVAPPGQLLDSGIGAL